MGIQTAQTLTEWASARATTESPSGYRLRRDGARDLEFSGWQIAQNESNPASPWGTRFSLYVTIGGSVVVHKEEIHRKTSDEVETTAASAEVSTWAEHALQWLIADNGGTLGTLGKALWTSACRGCKALADYETERVE